MSIGGACNAISVHAALCRSTEIRTDKRARPPCTYTIYVCTDTCVHEIETWINQGTKLIKRFRLLDFLACKFYTLNVPLFIPFLTSEEETVFKGSWRIRKLMDKGEGILIEHRGAESFAFCVIQRSTRWTKVITGNNSILSLPGAVYLPASAAD